MLANLFLHYAFDAWMARQFPNVPFERYCDNTVRALRQPDPGPARGPGDHRQDGRGRAAAAPDKTRIVYCKDANRHGEHEHTAFTFLGFTFRARPARARNGTLFSSFQPAISKQALKKISGEVRRWRLHRWIGLPIAEIARRTNPIVRGWMQYYGALYPVLQRINAYLMRWLRDKHKRLRPVKKARAAWQRITGQNPGLFAHWA